MRHLLGNISPNASRAVFGGMATLALGSGAGRLISLATIPIVTRIYGPEDFGVLSVFTAVVLILAPLATLRYVLALPLPRHDGLAMNLLALTACLLVGIGGLLALALWLLGEPLFGLLSMEVLAPWWWLIVLGVLGTAAYEAFTLWATRRRAYKVMAQTQVTQSVAGAGVKIALGLAGLQPLGLLIGQVVAQAGGTVRLWRNFVFDFRTNRHHVGISRMRKAAWHYRSMPIWRVPSQFLMIFSIQAPVLAFAALYDAATVGQLGLAFTALAIPISVLGETTSKAYYAEISRIGRYDPKSLLAVTRSTLSTMLIVSLGPSLVLFLFGEPIFEMVLGESWTVAGRYAEILSFYLLVQFLSNPISRVFSVLRIEWAYFLINTQRVILIVGGFIASGLLNYSPEDALVLFVILTSLHRLSIVGFILLTLKRRIR